MFYPLCTEVWNPIIFNWIIPSLWRRGRRAIAPLRTACRNRRYSLESTAPLHMAPWIRSSLCGEKRQVEACLQYSRNHSANLSEVLLTWEASSVQFNAALGKGARLDVCEKRGKCLALHLDCCEPHLHQARAGSWWIMSGNSTKQCEESPGCKTASRLISVKCTRDATHYASFTQRQFSRRVSWKVSLIRGYDMFKIGLSSLCLICQDLFMNASAPRLQSADPSAA